MTVKVTKDFRAVRPGEVYPSTIAAGEHVTGRLAEIARELGHAGNASSGHAPPPPSNDPGAGAPLPVGQDGPEAIVPPAGATVDVTIQPAGGGGATAGGETQTPVERDPNAPRVARAKFIKAYDGPDQNGVAVKFAKGSYIKGASAQHFVDIGLASIVELEK